MNKNPYAYAEQYTNDYTGGTGHFDNGVLFPSDDQVYAAYAHDAPVGPFRDERRIACPATNPGKEALSGDP